MPESLNVYKALPCNGDEKQLLGYILNSFRSEFDRAYKLLALKYALNNTSTLVCLLIRKYASKKYLSYCFISDFSICFGSSLDICGDWHETLGVSLKHSHEVVFGFNAKTTEIDVFINILYEEFVECKEDN